MQTQVFLADLVEATHLYIRLLEHHCHGNTHMIVQNKKKKSRPGKKKGKKVRTAV